MTRLALVAIVAMAACAHDKPGTGAKTDDPAATGAPDHGTSKSAAGADQAPVPIVSSQAEARAAVGKRVRVHGTAERDKLGDAVSVQGFSVVCLAPRFPDARLAQPVEVEGVLERTDEFQATKGPTGEISQGTEPGTFTYVIRRCALR